MSGLPGRIADVLAIDPAANVIEFDGQWRTWGQLADTVGQVSAHVGSPGGTTPPNPPAQRSLGSGRAGGWPFSSATPSGLPSRV